MHNFHIPSRRVQFQFFFFTNDFCETKQNKLEHELEPAWVLRPWISSALKEPLQQVLYCPLPCDIPWIETTTFPPDQDTPRPVANWFCAKISRLACSGYFNHSLCSTGWDGTFPKATGGSRLFPWLTILQSVHSWSACSMSRTYCIQIFAFIRYCWNK